MEVLLDNPHHNQSDIATAPIELDWLERLAQTTDLRTKSGDYIINTTGALYADREQREEVRASANELLGLVIEPLENTALYGTYDPGAAKRALDLIMPEALLYPGSMLSAIATIKDVRSGKLAAERQSAQSALSEALSEYYEHEAEADRNPATPRWKVFTEETRTQILEGIGKLLREGIPVDPVLDPEFTSKPPERRSPTEIAARDLALRTMPLLVQLGTNLGTIAEESIPEVIARIDADTSRTHTKRRLMALGRQMKEATKTRKAA